MHQDSTKQVSRPLPNEPEAYLFGWAVVELIHNIRVSWDQSGGSADEILGLEKLEQSRANVVKLASQLLGEIATGGGGPLGPFQALRDGLEKAWRLFRAARISPDVLDARDVRRSFDDVPEFASYVESPIVVYQVEVVGGDLEAVSRNYDRVVCPLLRHRAWSDFLSHVVAFCEALPPDLRDMAFLGLTLAQMSYRYEVSGEYEYSVESAQTREWLVRQMRVFWDEYDALGFTDSDELEPPFDMQWNPMKRQNWSREIDRRLREKWYGPGEDRRVGEYAKNEDATKAGQHLAHSPPAEQVSDQKPGTTTESASGTARVSVCFPAPEGLTWEEVKIAFVSDTSVRVSARDINKRYMFDELGFRDGRKGDLPDTRWRILQTLARHGGKTDWGSNISPKDKNRMSAAIKDIRKRLKKLVGLNDDPFYPYREAKAYITRFSLCDESYSETSDETEDP